MKRLLLSLLAAIALPTAVNAEKFDITCFWKLENYNRPGEAVQRFIIDTELDKGSLTSYDKGADGKKEFLDEKMVEFINSPMQIEVIYDQGYSILFDSRFGISYVFDKKDISSPIVTNIVKKIVVGMIQITKLDIAILIVKKRLSSFLNETLTTC